MKLFNACLFLLSLNISAFSQPTLVCLGDSLTAGLGLDEDQAYPALLEARLSNWKVVNAGVSGDTSAGGLKRLDWILKAKPAAVFLALGANDGLRGIKPSETEKNLDAIVTKIMASGASVYLAGMLVPTNYGEKYASEFRALFPRVARRQKVPLLPFILEGVGGHPQLNQADGIHPTAEGARIVAEHVYQFLIKRLPHKQSSGK